MNQEIMQIAQLMKGRNPKQAAMQMIKNSNIADPMIMQLISFAENGDQKSFINLADSFFKQQGMNMDSEFSALMSLLK